MEALGCESGARTAAQGRLRFPCATFFLSRARATGAGGVAICLALCLTVLLAAGAAAQEVEASFKLGRTAIYGLIDNSRCIEGETLDDYQIPTADQCRKDGINIDPRGYEFRGFDAAGAGTADPIMRNTRIRENSQTRTESLSLSLTITGGWEWWLRVGDHQQRANRGELSTSDDRGLGFDGINGDNLATVRINTRAGVEDFSEYIELNFGLGRAPGLDPLPDNAEIFRDADRLDRIQLTGLEIWTQSNQPQSFEVRSLKDDDPGTGSDGRIANPLNQLWLERAFFTTDNAQKCKSLDGTGNTATGYCQSFSLSLVSHVGRFLIIGTQLAADTPLDEPLDLTEGVDRTAGIRLRSFTYQAATQLPEDPAEEEQDLSPFRFSAQSFDAFIDSADPGGDDCIARGALTTLYDIDEDQQCNGGGAGMGWEFELPSKARREERSVEGNDVTVVAYGLRLTVTGGTERDVFDNPNSITENDALEADGTDGGRGLGVRGHHDNDSPNLSARTGHIRNPADANQCQGAPIGGPLDNGACLAPNEEFIELNFTEFEYERREFTLAGQQDEPSLPLDRIHLTGLEIWTESNKPQSFEVRALRDETPTTNRLKDPIAAKATFRTDNVQPCAPLDGSAGTRPGYCQSFALSLVSHVGRFLIIGTQLSDDDLTDGIRLRSMTFETQTAIPLPPPDPAEAAQDLNPFRFSAQSFNAFIETDDLDNDDCIADGALATQYNSRTHPNQRCNGSDGTAAVTGHGWEFELPSEVWRAERSAEGSEVTYGLRLTVTGSFESQEKGSGVSVLHADNSGRGLGVRSFFNPTDDSPNLQSLASNNGVLEEFIELNFSEVEIGTAESPAAGLDPIETRSLERIRLTGLEIWTETETPQRFQVRALLEEPRTDGQGAILNRLEDPVVTQLDLITDDARPCPPHHGPAGTHAGGGYCQSFALSLVSHVGRFLIVGTQLADSNPMAGIRLRTIQYEFQTAMGLPLPGGLALALTGLAGLGGIALRRRRRIPA